MMKIQTFNKLGCLPVFTLIGAFFSSIFFSAGLFSVSSSPVTTDFSLSVFVSWEKHFQDSRPVLFGNNLWEL